MFSILPRALALASLLAVGHASATLTLYGREDFRGARTTLSDATPAFGDFGFNDQASSVVVEDESWEVCRDVGFRNRCVVLSPGSYPNLASMGMDDHLSSARPVRRYDPPPPPVASSDDIVFYEHRDFHGRGYGLSSEVRNFREFGANDRTSSVIVFEGRWEACEHADFGGRCVLLRPGRYPDLAAMGLNDQLSSVRRVRHGRHRHADNDGPDPLPAYDWRRRPSETLVQVPVEDVRAVYASPQQRCWTERSADSSDRGVAGAVIGGIIGGILGHQIGDGGGRDAATAGGVFAGAVIGSQAGRSGEVQRCEDVPSNQPPQYYDVTYRFQGQRHHVQTTQPPGSTILVNSANGEPRL